MARAFKAEGLTLVPGSQLEPGLTWGGRCRSTESSSGEEDHEGGCGDLHGGSRQSCGDARAVSQECLQGSSETQVSPFIEARADRRGVPTREIFKAAAKHWLIS